MPIYEPVQWGTNTAAGNWFAKLPFVANNDMFGVVFELDGDQLTGRSLRLTFSAQPLGRFEGEPKPEDKSFGSIWLVDRPTAPFSGDNQPRDLVENDAARSIYEFGTVTTGVNEIDLWDGHLRALVAQGDPVQLILGPVFGQPGDIVLNGTLFRLSTEAKGKA